MSEVRERLNAAGAWARAHPARTAGGALLGAVGLFLLVAFSATPRLDRDWVDNLERMPDIEMRRDGFSMTHVRDWSYAQALEEDGDKMAGVTRSEASFEGDFSVLRNVWFMIEPHPGMEMMAHTLVLFEFADDRMVGLTIEARKEEGETYSALWGTFNAFELAYIWATPKDLLTRRAVYLDHDVLVYPLALSDEQELSFLSRLLDKTVAISSKARWYNTLFSNCTNELAKTADLDWHHAFIMTGYSAERLFELGLIPGDDFESTKARARMTDEIKAWNDLSPEDFNRALLAELRARGEG